MQAYAGTDIGCVRTMNQDGYFCSTTPIGPFHFPGKGLICPEFPEKDQGINTGNAHNGKNNPGHGSECAEEVADQVKFKKTDESPVNSSNDDQYQSCNVKPVPFHVNSSFREAA